MIHIDTNRANHPWANNRRQYPECIDRGVHRVATIGDIKVGLIRKRWRCWHGGWYCTVEGYRGIGQANRSIVEYRGLQDSVPNIKKYGIHIARVYLHGYANGFNRFSNAIFKSNNRNRDRGLSGWDDQIARYSLIISAWSGRSKYTVNDGEILRTKFWKCKRHRTRHTALS